MITYELVTVVSIETIGFGDFHPTDTRSRVFAIVYNTIGILNLGMAISTCRETIIESFEHSYRKRLRRMAETRSLKREKRFRKTAIENALRKAGLPVFVHVHTTDAEGQRKTVGGGRGGGGYRKRTKHRVLNEKALSTDEMRAAMEEVEAMLHISREHTPREHQGSKILEQPGCSNENDSSTEPRQPIEDIGVALNAATMREELKMLSGTQQLLDALTHNLSSAVYQEQRKEFFIKVTGCPIPVSIVNPYAFSSPLLGLSSYSSGW